MVRAIVHMSGYTLGALRDSGRIVDRANHTVVYPHKDWDTVCWGDHERGLLGRIPMTLWLAKSTNASKIIWSSGASRIPGGVWESEYQFETALHSYSQLAKDFPQRFSEASWRSERAFKDWLERVSILDTESTNTRTSLDWLAEYVRKTHGQVARSVFLVSSANHAPRVLRDAMRAFRCGTPLCVEKSRTSLVCVPAETNYGGKTVVDTKVHDLGD